MNECLLLASTIVLRYRDTFPDRSVEVVRRVVAVALCETLSLLFASKGVKVRRVFFVTSTKESQVFIKIIT